MKSKDSWIRRAMTRGGVAALVVFAVLVGLRFMSEPEVERAPETPAPDESAPRTTVTTASAPVPAPSPLPDEDPEPEDDVPRAVQPREGEAWSLVNVPLTCAVEPPLVGLPLVGKSTPLTWPGDDHEPQPDGLLYPAIPIDVTVDAGEATATTFLPVLGSGDDPIRHVARLVLPGFAPTEFTFITTGPDQPALCEEPIQLSTAAQGVVGTVRFQDGSPAEGAIINGCGTRVIAGSDGAYFLLPREQESCSLQARHAPGSAAESAPLQVDPTTAEDQVLDFVLEMPDQPDPGVEIFRTDDGEIWIRPVDSGPWARKLVSGARITHIGDVPADALSDEELNRAMVSLDETVHVEQYFETEDGQDLHVQVAITEL